MKFTLYSISTQKETILVGSIIKVHHFPCQWIKTFYKMIIFSLQFDFPIKIFRTSIILRLFLDLMQNSEGKKAKGISFCFFLENFININLGLSDHINVDSREH